MGSTRRPKDRWNGREVLGYTLVPFLSVGLAVYSVRLVLPGLRGARPHRLYAASPGAAGALLPGDGSENSLPVGVLVARAVARSKLHEAGGLVIASPRQLAATPFGTRYLARQCRFFTSYASFVRRFGDDVPQRAPGRRGVLLILGHGGNGIGLEAVCPLSQIRLPSGAERPRRSMAGEMVALRRLRADIGGKWDVIALGECNPRACLRSLAADIPIGPELFHSFQVANWPARQLRVVRNLRENIYLMGNRVVGREPYTPPASRMPLARVIAPDVIGCQYSAQFPEESSMTDVFLLTGRWTDQPTSRKSRQAVEPTPALIRQADRAVRSALADEIHAAQRSRASRAAQARPERAASAAPARGGSTR